MDMEYKNLIDIHSHIITKVDDGSDSIEASIYLLNKAKEAGVSDIILTPHYRRGMFETPLNDIYNGYNDLVNLAKENKIEINLYLGQEIYIHKTTSFKDYLEKERVIPLNNSDYYLLEFSYDSEIDISEVVYNAKLLKKKVVIAHIEKYNYVNLNTAFDIKNTGALIQVNASSIVGRYGFGIKRKTLKYIKEGLVDFVASDCHAKREYDFLKAYNIILRRFGEKVANKLFSENAKELLLKKRVLKWTNMQ